VPQGGKPLAEAPAGRKAAAADLPLEAVRQRGERLQRPAAAFGVPERRQGNPGGLGEVRLCPSGGPPGFPEVRAEVAMEKVPAHPRRMHAGNEQEVDAVRHGGGRRRAVSGGGGEFPLRAGRGDGVGHHGVRIANAFLEFPEHRSAERQGVAGRFGPEGRFGGGVRVRLDDHLDQFVVRPHPGGRPAVAVAVAASEKVFCAQGCRSGGVRQISKADVIRGCLPSRYGWGAAVQTWVASNRSWPVANVYVQW